MTAFLSFRGIFLAPAAVFGRSCLNVKESARHGQAIALLAFDATPKIATAVTDALVSLPGRIADRFLPKKD